MSQSVTVNGVVYAIPDVDDEDWGQNVTDYLVAISVVASATQSFMTTVNVTSSPVTVVMGRTYLVDTTAARTLQLPAASTNFYFIVKDKTGGAASFNITIARAGSESIDGVAGNKTLARPFGTWVLVSDGTNWFTINQFPDTGIINADVASSAAIAHSKMAALTASVALVSDGSGVVAASSVTSTELAGLHSLTASRAVVTTAGGILTASATTAAQVGFLSTVTSDVQTQINTKITAGTGAIVNADVNASAAIAVSKLAAVTASKALVSDGSGFIAASTVTTTELQAIHGLTASRALVSDGSGLVSVSSVTSTEVGYLSGVTSAIQTQLNAITGATNPTIQKFTSGSGTYTTPAGVKWIRIIMVGAGGGGSGSSTNAANDGGTGGTGGTSTFGTTLLSTVGGSGGTKDTQGAGGTASLGSGPIGLALSGGTGTGGDSSGLVTGYAGGPGGTNPLGGCGGGASNSGGAGSSGATNTGAGGGGAGMNTTGSKSGCGGGAGGFVEAIITSPAATYAYSVGAAGTAGAAGTTGSAGGAGGSGVIVVEEHYLA